MNISPSFKRSLIALFAWLLLLIYAGNHATAQSSPALTARQVAELKNVSEVVMSEDGSRIAYTLRVPADPLTDNDPASYHLYLYSRQDGAPVPFFTDGSVSSVRFRPGANSLTFLTRKEEDNSTSLYQIPLSGGEAQKLYSFGTSIGGYTWAPGGNRVAFMANEPVTAETAALPYQPEVYEEGLVQRRGYVLNLSQEDPQPRQIQVEGSIYQVRWSPGGDRLAVAAAPTPLIDDFYMAQQVYITGGDGQQVVGRIDHEGKLGQLGWSPDGSRLAMIAGADINDPIDGRLFVVSANGGTPRNLVPGYEGQFHQFSWADDNTLRYLSSEGTGSSYGTIEADGSDREAMIDEGSLNFFQFSRSRNGVVAFLADHPTHPAEVYLMESTGSAPRRITNSNPWLDEVPMGRQEVITWEARDGLELQGVLIYPVDYRAGEPYPLLAVVHGGPESHNDDGWLTAYSLPGQVGAGNDFVVFYPNYRGSTGRGIDFLKSSQGDLAGAEFDDIVDGVDFLISEGIVDPDRVGVTGGSYGGYATGWLSTRYSERFAAGVMFVGISDNISKWGTSDIPEELYLVHARKRVWDDYEFFLERSPIYYAGEAETPLLILAGKEDTRVDPGQSYELYRHIKTRTETPVRLVLYPGEGHGNARATARLDYNLRMIRWFEAYLKGNGTKPDSRIEQEQVSN